MSKGHADLPDDLDRAVLLGRAMRPGEEGGPCVVTVREGQVLDLTPSFATTAELLNSPDPVAAIRQGAAHAASLGSAAELMEASLARKETEARFLAPCDLQAIKAAGVTFVESLIERLIEEIAKGDPGRATEVRKSVQAIIGADLTTLRPGSPEAAEVKRELQLKGAWSQYLEVGIGPDAEIFTKCQPMSAVGYGSEIGVHPSSKWSNPEPELVMVVNARGEAVGATLGNDVNLRDIEGRSALLLGRAKDNNGSCALGPLIRLFDEHFALDDVRKAEIAIEVRGEDDFVLQSISLMQRISRDPIDLVGQLMNGHQYPDGALLFTGTMFAPIADRDEPGLGFTHHLGDRVKIASPLLGTLINEVGYSDHIPSWTMGVQALMQNLARRGLLGRPSAVG